MGEALRVKLVPRVDQMLSILYLHLRPLCKPSPFSVVSITSQGHFWSNKQYFAIEENNSTVVSNVSVHNRHPNITDHIFGDG